MPIKKKLSPSINYWLIPFLAAIYFSDAAAVTNLSRTITFKNLCNEKIWIAFTPSYIPGNKTFCAKDSDCLRGASCVGAQCVYPIPVPTGSNPASPWELAAYQKDNPDDPATQSKMEIELQYSIPDPHNPEEVVYQYVANFGARTGCSFVKDGKHHQQLICETGQCLVDEVGGCISGMSNPSTHAEITFNNTAVDFYDISFVNGVNIPIGISPADDPVSIEPYGQAPLFWCGKSGFFDARSEFYKLQPNSDNLIGCNWNFKLPAVPTFEGYDSSVFYTIVNYTGNIFCTSDSECDPADRCGYSLNDTASTAAPKCGRPIAYNVLANICGSPFNQGPSLLKKAFGCYSEPGAVEAFKMQAYAMCAKPPNAPPEITAPPTCYVNGSVQPDPECCGCIAWEKKLPLGAESTCRAGDVINAPANFWQTHIRDKVLWLADQCLAGYAYQFDDVHSTFTCSSVKNPSTDKPNQLNYTVTFCPDGQQLFNPLSEELNQFSLFFNN